MKSLVAVTYSDMESEKFCKTSYMLRENGSERRPFIFFLYRIVFLAIFIGQIKFSQKVRNGKKKNQAIMYTSLANSNEVTLIFFFKCHCMKNVCIRSCSSPYSVQMRDSADQRNTKYRHFSRTLY